jgi:hypothetical protein
LSAKQKDDSSNPEINISKIRAGGGIAGLIFAIGSMLIFLLGIPGLWYFFAFAIALGVGIAVVLRLANR